MRRRCILAFAKRANHHRPLRAEQERAHFTPRLTPTCSSRTPIIHPMRRCPGQSVPKCCAMLCRSRWGVSESHQADLCGPSLARQLSTVIIPILIPSHTSQPHLHPLSLSISLLVVDIVARCLSRPVSLQSYFSPLDVSSLYMIKRSHDEDWVSAGMPLLSPQSRDPHADVANSSPRKSATSITT